MVVKAISLISPEERILLNDFVFVFKNQNFVNLKYFDNKSCYIPLEIEHVFKKSEEFLSSHQRPIDKSKLFDVLLKVYLNLKNNTISEKKYPILFSDKFIPLIISIC